MYSRDSTEEYKQKLLKSFQLCQQLIHEVSVLFNHIVQIVVNNRITNHNTIWWNKPKQNIELFTAAKLNASYIYST